MEVNRRLDFIYIYKLYWVLSGFYLQKETERSGYLVLNACLGKNPTVKQNPTEAFKSRERLASLVVGEVSREEARAFLKAGLDPLPSAGLGASQRHQDPRRGYGLQFQVTFKSLLCFQ